MRGGWFWGGGRRGGRARWSWNNGGSVVEERDIRWAESLIDDEVVEFIMLEDTGWGLSFRIRLCQTQFSYMWNDNFPSNKHQVIHTNS